MANTEIHSYDEISPGQKQALMNQSAQWLSLKPELIGEVKTDKELIDRLVSFAKILYDHFPQERGGAWQSLHMASR